MLKNFLIFFIVEFVFFQIFIINANLGSVSIKSSVTFNSSPFWSVFLNLAYCDSKWKYSNALPCNPVAKLNHNCKWCLWSLLNCVKYTLHPWLKSLIDIEKWKQLVNQVMALTAGSPWIIFVNFSSTSKWFVLIIILFYSIDTDIFNYSMPWYILWIMT